VVHTTVRPVVTEEQVQRVTREHHHHHVRTRILPVVDRHVLPTKYYLQFDPDNPRALREISAEEAKTYGEPVYQAEHVVSGDPHAEEVFCATTTAAKAPVARTRPAVQDSEDTVVRDLDSFSSFIPDHHLGGDGDGDETRKNPAADSGVLRSPTFGASRPWWSADKTDSVQGTGILPDYL
jgi:hypothetical protein